MVEQSGVENSGVEMSSIKKVKGYFNPGLFNLRLDNWG